MSEQKIRRMISRGDVARVDDSGGLQLLQVGGMADETLDGVERVQNFGLSSYPPAGATPIVVAVGGSRDHMVAVAVDHEDHRPTDINEGETVLYNAHGVSLVLDKEGNATLTCKKFIVNAEDSIQANTPLANFSQAVTAGGLFTYKAGMAGTGGDAKTYISGDIVHQSGSLQSNGITLDKHKHDGVKAGSDESGDPV